MAITRWRPFQELRSMTQEMLAMPKMDVYSEGDDLVVKMEVPEMKPEDVNVSLQDSSLMVSGRLEREKNEEKKNYYMKERYAGSFMREIPLPREVSEADVKANMRQGILEIRVKGAARHIQGAKRIPIGTAENENGQAGS
jgi:HSP20 family protein